MSGLRMAKASLESLNMARCYGKAMKRDSAEKAIVDALRACGAFVVRLSGEDCPDLLVRWQGRWTPLEVKTGKGKATKEQAQAGYPLVRTVKDALAVFGIAG